MNELTVDALMVKAKHEADALNNTLNELARLGCDALVIPPPRMDEIGSFNPAYPRRVCLGLFFKPKEITVP